MRGNNRTRRRVALTPLLFVHCLPQIGLSPQFYRQQISEIGVKTKRSDKDKARRGPGFSGVPMSGVVPQIGPSVPQPFFTITEKAPTRAFSWLKAPTSAFTFKTLC